jgi:hypothetical protein
MPEYGMETVASQKEIKNSPSTGKMMLTQKFINAQGPILEQCKEAGAQQLNVHNSEILQNS